MLKRLLLVSIYIYGVVSNSANVDTESISSAINELKNDADVERFKGIKTPDDISQIKDWKNRCREEHGVETLKEIEAYPKKLIDCVLQYVKPDKLQIEVNRSMARGSLDLVFKKYCGESSVSGISTYGSERHKSYKFMFRFTAIRL
ncbi:Protein of unknown function DUF1397 [Trinorchestia longiramus]|nr:Protein of unknown function DUF1397 [Trinorchestia longiramus]